MDFKAYLRSLGIGLFYAAYIYIVDRVIHVGGMGNGIIMLLMSIAALMIAIGTFTVRKDSQYSLPMKYPALLLGVIAGMIVIYAFFGTMTGRENFVQAFAASKVLPAMLQNPLNSYVDFGKVHSVPWLPQPKPKGPVLHGAVG